MAGRGPAPKADGRRNRQAPQRGDYKAPGAAGWQHGPIPAPPARLTAAARETWQTWMESWFASHWTPADLPNLRLIVVLYSTIASRRATAAERSEFRQLADSYGITPKGQQDRRWTAPKPDQDGAQSDVAPSPYAHLGIVVNE